jgi:holo-[acyl-carrier protein] synthase
MFKDQRIKNFGIGVDIEQIDRFNKLDFIGNNSFLNKIYTDSELEYCFSKKKAAPYLAVRYAGKEAIVKALTSLSQPSLKYNEIEIFNDENGAPKVRFNNVISDDLDACLSLSHCKDRALAFAVVMEFDCCEED